MKTNNPPYQKFQKKKKKINTSFVPFLLGFAKCPQIAVEKMERGSDDIAVWWFWAEIWGMEKTRLVSWRGKTRIMQNRFIFFFFAAMAIVVFFSSCPHFTQIWASFSNSDGNPVHLAQKTEAIGENGDFFFISGMSMISSLL